MLRRRGENLEESMRVSISKSAVAGVAAVVLSAATSLTPAPAEAAFFHGGGFGGFHGGGFGGFHGGGFGGWRGGGWGGYGRGGYGYGAYGYGGWWWPGFATGALLGAAATYPYWGGYYGYPYYGYGYGYPYYGAGYGYGYGYGYGNGNGCLVYRRTYNRYGHYIGRRLVNVCM
jgi:hypothetical protein